MKNLFYLLILFSTLSSKTLVAQETVSMSDMINDIQRLKSENGTHLYVYYFPIEYWDIALQGNPNVSPEAITYLKSILEGYVVVMVGNIQMNKKGPGDIEYKPLADLSKNLLLTDQNGQTYKPLKYNEMSQDAGSLVENIQPILASMLGKFGAGMKIFLFDVSDKQGHNLIQAKENTPFSIRFYNEVFQWDLPLSVFVPKKSCPVDQEQLNGKWNYCPIHGNKLE